MTGGWRSSIRVVDLESRVDTEIYLVGSALETLNHLEWTDEGRHFLAIEGGSTLVRLRADTGEREVVADPFMSAPAPASADGTILQSVGLTPLQADAPAADQVPRLTTVDGSLVSSTALPDRLTFAGELSLSACSRPG